MHSETCLMLAGVERYGNDPVATGGLMFAPES
jgi:hypothetical protein